jgi:hypothetical protein
MEKTASAKDVMTHAEKDGWLVLKATEDATGAGRICWCTHSGGFVFLWYKGNDIVGMSLASKYNIAG